ncbi:MAG: ABC transporter ATP-binding protein [Candidatus Dormibacteraeota bacterium]|nr:ABC transporter ATP-binding protein [Candidatus Dormibacteraeota bacterium]
MATIETIGLTKRYGHGSGAVRALDGVDVRIESGEFVAVVGRSGSGKTTMLDVLGLLARPTSGTVLIDGADTTQLSDGRRADLRGRRIGFVFQEYNLLPALSVTENVLLPLRYTDGRGRAGRAGRTRAERLPDYVGLGERTTHRPSELSGGQQQRVAIARSLINEPALVLADEPTGAVDSRTAAELLSLMRRLNREEGVTFVIVTHDLELAGSCDRSIRLADGRVAVDEAPREQRAVA